MKAFMEKTSLLALSLMLVSTFSVSSALPQMISYYQAQGYTSSQVELLVSLSSFAIIAVLLLNPIINRFIPERISIILGLLLLSVGGSAPYFNQAYPLVFASRLILGIGIGLINAHAINIISQRFSGKERIRMLGLRGSAEVLGSAILTFIAGQLLSSNWSNAFMVYGFGLPILALYLIFVPKTKEEKATQVSQEKEKVSFATKELLYILGLALYAGFVILINSINTLRIPVIVDSLGLGTASQSSLILSLMMLMGILAGTQFSAMVSLLRAYFMPIVLFVLAAGVLVVWTGASLWLIGLGAILTGFVYSLGVTFVFHLVSERMKGEKLATATTLVLLGCNLGGAIASLALRLFDSILPTTTGAFLILAILSLILGLILLLPALRQGRK
ncbi:MFS transporter [Streptococcus loxodontisalivarius]|uniref:MFS family permease n=1 Tax=Streptococcus loxodontisalivarius TaxID=1349415 RepID=A0ABS2PR23_9STRE|nr:MFS transporter [Streptococcus loxodontisalivarius]MBM7642497.1 MFS family permease [Streptococcus loxodontisalivarius]